MTVDCMIVEEPLRLLEAYGEIPIRYDVKSVFDVELQDSGLGGFSLVERKLDEPFTKDYDAMKGEGPSRWASKWNIDNWGLISAVAAGQRVGGCVLAYNTAGLEMLEGRDDIAVLWDIRVHPHQRGYGIGSILFTAATEWAKKRGCRLLMAETQNINVPACRFYPLSRRMLVASLPGIRRASGPVPVTADVGQQKYCRANMSVVDSMA